MSEWISVKERLPEIGHPVLCNVNNCYGTMSIVLSRETGTYEEEIEWFTTFVIKVPNFDYTFSPTVDDATITHWMPLPPPPE